MPIYEYHCHGCQKSHEIIQKFSDAPLTICPACGGRLEKLLSLSGFQLKGGGWYKDGYASSGGGNTPKCTPSGCEKPGCKTSDKK